MDLRPITHAYELRCARELAFDVFTRRIGEWWPATYTMNPATLRAVTLEPRVGGRLFATHRDEGEHEWGRVRLWEPGHRLAVSWTLAQPPEHPSELTVSFVEREGGCTVLLEHGGWSAANALSRSKFSDWPLILERFAALAGA